MSADKLQAQIDAVQSLIATERKLLERHRKDWRTAASCGMHGHCEELEGAITKTERKLLRLDVQREHLQEQLNATQPAEV